MPRGRALDIGAVRAAVAAGLTLAAIAERFDCSKSGIARIMRIHKINASWQRVSVSEKAARWAAAAPVVLAPEGSLERTGGRHAELAAWAATNQLTLRQAQQRWFALGRVLGDRSPSEAQEDVMDENLKKRLGEAGLYWSRRHAITAAELARVEEVGGWLHRFLVPDDAAIVQARAMGLSWRQICSRSATPRATVAARWTAAIASIEAGRKAEARETKARKKAASDE
jgi:hypothetical protein